MNRLQKHVTAEKTNADKDWDVTEEMRLGILEILYILKRTSRPASLKP